MEQQPMNHVAPQQLVAVAQAPRPVDPRQQYDGQMFLADRQVDLQYVKRHVQQPSTLINEDGLVVITNPLGLQQNPLYIPTLPIIYK